jgi:RNA polymerase sigma-70 factor (ECF subfamily)
MTLVTMNPPVAKDRTCPDPTGEDDRYLMERMAAGDPTALDEALQRYWQPLLRFASARLEDPGAAEDIVQDTFLALWERRARWRPSDSLRPLLYRILRNRILDSHRSDRVRVRWLRRFRRLETGVLVTPFENAEAGELTTAVSCAIDALSPRRREVFLLVRHENLSYRQISAVMGISEQTVANHMSAAMGDLRRTLEPYLDESRVRRGKLRGDSHRPN